MIFRCKISLFKENQHPISTGYSEIHFIWIYPDAMFYKQYSKFVKSLVFLNIQIAVADINPKQM